MKARSIHCALDIQAAIGCAEKNVGNGGDDARSARRADDKANFVVLEHNDGRHAGQGALPGSNRIRRALDQPKHIRRTDLRGKVVHLIIEQEPQSIHGRPGAESVIQGIRN